MSDEHLRKSYKYKRRPTPDQARQLEQTLWRWRTLYNTAREQRKVAYERWGVTLSAYGQQAELPDCPTSKRHFRNTGKSTRKSCRMS